MSIVAYILCQTTYTVHPPPERKDDEGLLDALEIPHPNFIPFVGEERSKLSLPSSTSLIFPQVIVRIPSPDISKAYSNLNVLKISEHKIFKLLF